MNILKCFPIYDHLWENPSIMHKDKYLEMHNSIIQSIISQEGLATGLHFVINLKIFIVTRLPTPQCTAS